MMRIVIFTSWGGAFVNPVLRKLINDKRLQILKIYSQGIHIKRISKYHPSYYLNYKDNVAEMIARENCENYEIIDTANADNIIEFIKNNAIDYVFTIGYGEILKAEIIKSPKKGIINFHPGLLPENQGADPIASVLINDLATTGITFHLIDEGIDTGSIILKKEMKLSEKLSYDGLQLQLGFFTSSITHELLSCLLTEQLVAVNQKENRQKYYKKLKNIQGQFNFNMCSDKIDRVIRTYSGFYKKAYFVFKTYNLHIGSCEVVDNAFGYEAGEIIDQALGYLCIATNDSAVLLKDIVVDDLTCDLSNQLLNKIFNKSIKLIV